MDESSLDYRLSDEERTQFDELGFLIVRNVIEPAQVAQLEAAADRLEADWRPRYEKDRGLKPGYPLNHLDFIGYDPAFLELLDCPKTIMKVVDILGWHIQLYHSHIIVTPPLPADYVANARLGWHQDSGRLNIDIESNPRPRISLKVGFFLSDTTETDRGNFHVIPGSHLTNKVEFPVEGEEHPDAVPVQAAPGDAVFFDRRLWHAAGRNMSGVTRKVLFYGYSYRWLKPRDNMTVSHYMADADPVRRQLLGDSPNGGFGFTSPTDEDVPLKGWLEQRLGEEALVP